MRKPPGEYQFNSEVAKNNIPSELKKRNQWVAWKLEQREGASKPTKVPVNPNTLRNASCNDPASWGSFEAALGASRNNHSIAGIGFVFTDDDPYVGIDLDGVICERSGNLSDLAQDVVAAVDSYTEISPSGTGIHIILRGNVSGTGNRKDCVEIYQHSRYFTFTGNVFHPVREIISNQSGLNYVHQKYIGGPPKQKTEQSKPRPMVMSDKELERQISLPKNDKLREILAGECDAFQSLSEMDFAACAQLIELGASDSQVESMLRGSEIYRPKYDRSDSGLTYLRRTIRQAREKVAHTHEDEASFVHEMNKTYAVIAGERKAFVLREAENGDGGLDAKLMELNSFKLWTQNLPLVGKKTAAQIWLTSPDRRQYENLIFAPNETPPKTQYNLWRGFAGGSVEGDCEVFLDFIKRIICKCDTDKFDYVINWLAFLLQKPNELPEVALVLMGGQGTGKGTFTRPLLQIAGQHGIELSTVDQLTGRFNSHLADKVFVHANESTWGGNKQYEGALKTLITERNRPVERKGMDIQNLRNCVHLIISSNEEWPVPAAVDDRRFAFFEVSDQRQQDTAYFGQIHRWLDSGGTAYLRHYLEHKDIGDWHPRQRPKGVSGAGVRFASACSVTKWWYQCLEDEVLLGSDFGGEFSSTFLDSCVDKSLIYSAYRNHVGNPRERVEGNILIKKLHKLCRHIRDRRPTDVVTGKRVRQLCFPDATVARTDFTNATGIPFED
jgi:hypothetical protein